MIHLRLTAILAVFAIFYPANNLMAQTQRQTQEQYFGFPTPGLEPDDLPRSKRSP